MYNIFMKSSHNQFTLMGNSRSLLSCVVTAVVTYFTHVHSRQQDILSTEQRKKLVCVLTRLLF